MMEADRFRSEPTGISSRMRPYYQETALTRAGKLIVAYNIQETFNFTPQQRDVFQTHMARSMVLSKKYDTWQLLNQPGVAVLVQVPLIGKLFQFIAREHEDYEVVAEELATAAEEKAEGNIDLSRDLQNLANLIFGGHSERRKVKKQQRREEMREIVRKLALGRTGEIAS